MERLQPTPWGDNSAAYEPMTELSLDNARLVAALSPLTRRSACVGALHKSHDLEAAIFAPMTQWRRLVGATVAVESRRIQGEAAAGKLLHVGTMTMNCCMLF